MNSQEAKKLEDKVLTILRNHIGAQDSVIAAISGGPDSMFLLHFLKQIPCKLIVAHLNHKLREEADLDEKFVQKTHDKVVTRQADIRSLAGKAKKGLEETAREVRYKFLYELFKKHRAKFIITAHHADDNLETILFNFIRGTGLQGLCGMQELDGEIFRPLLQFSKTQILEYLKLRKIKFRTDKTNTDTTITRNFLRHKIIPQLKKLNPNITNTTAKTSSNLRQISTYLQDEADKWLTKNSIQQGLNAKNFRTQEPALQKIILLNAYRDQIGDTKNLEAIHLEEVLDLIKKNTGNKKKKLGKLVISLKNNIIRLTKS